MTEKEKRTLKDGVKNLIGKYKALEHGIIEVLENNIFSFINSMQEESVSEDILDMSRIDYRLQHQSIQDGIKYHAEEYSFNTESVLYNQLTPEQQKLWHKDIEDAVISGGYCGWELARDKRYKENQEPVSEDLEEAATTFADVHVYATRKVCFKAGAQWQKANLWKPADGNDLPEIDREVIALLDNGKVVFAHRPPEYWDGKDIVTGKITRNYPKTYGKGGWNIPNIKYFLDVELPKETEL